MKKLIISLLVGLFMAFMLTSCATTQTKKPDPHAHITIDNVQNECKAAESWQIAIMGVPAYILVFEDCLQINKLLIISVNTNTHTEEIRKHSVKLIELHYIAYMEKKIYPYKEATEMSETLDWSIKKLREEDRNGWRVHFYNITYKKRECSDNSCKQN